MRTVDRAAEIAARVQQVRERVSVAAARAGRDESDVTIVAVSKTFPPESIIAAVDAGVSDVAENKVQELRSKRTALGDPRIRWHLVGSLQRNKVRHAVGAVALIHGVDSRELAGEIGRQAQRRGLEQDVLLQVNVSGEGAKHGVRPEDALRIADAVAGDEAIRLRGLMTIAPQDDPEGSRQAFAALRALRARIASEHPDVVELSMGMSDDLEIAVEEGATLVRIGRAIFGPREP